MGNTIQQESLRNSNLRAARAQHGMVSKVAKLKPDAREKTRKELEDFCNMLCKKHIPAEVQDVGFKTTMHFIDQMDYNDERKHHFGHTWIKRFFTKLLIERKGEFLYVINRAKPEVDRIQITMEGKSLNFARTDQRDPEKVVRLQMITLFVGASRSKQHTYVTMNLD